LRLLVTAMRVSFDTGIDITKPWQVGTLPLISIDCNCNVLNSMQIVLNDFIQYSHCQFVELG